MTSNTSIHPEIPKGPYCGGCQYLSIRSDLPKQYNGYCEFLGKSDLDLNREIELTDIDTGDKYKAYELSFPVSLLWDGCKMCGINDDWDDEHDYSPPIKCDGE